ncbi:hypothetical protein TNIN_460891 [Trichonephila inaurata madagascariensis]|uniref:Uncharacterized protein n=1 Tax=Trichonephila inaurata madagascariensis TaxID=2747483 RepID=A0A8X6WSC3_9ARAC|nr:hypothetical protein TNIN_460891 [Trichonephila inaurata madagascariensis]
MILLLVRRLFIEGRMEYFPGSDLLAGCLLFSSCVARSEGTRLLSHRSFSYVVSFNGISVQSFVLSGGLLTERAARHSAVICRLVGLKQ